MNARVGLPFHCAVVLVFVILGNACSGGGGGGAQPAQSNHVPVATDASHIVEPGASLSENFPASDSDGDTLTFTIITEPSNGDVTAGSPDSGQFTYVPDAGFHGVDTFSFAANDGTATSASATVTIQVNSKPMAVAKAYRTNELGPLVGKFESSDEEDDAVTYAIVQSPSKGMVTLTDASTGEFEYVPDAGADGADNFTYVAADDYQDSPETSVSIDIFAWQGTQQFGSAAEEFAGPTAFVRDAGGDFYIGGLTVGSVDGTANAGGDDEFLQKRDARGNVLWTVQGGTAGNDYLKGVAISGASDDLYVATRDEVRRLNPDGTVVWSRTIDGLINPDIVNQQIAVDAAGDVYTIHLQEINDSVSTRLDKYNGVDGALLWSRQLQSSVSDPGDTWISNAQTVEALGLSLDSQDNPVIVGGAVTGGILGGFIGILDSESGADIRVTHSLHHSESCAKDPAMQFTGATLDASDNVYVVGNTDDGAYPNDAIVAKYDAQGAEQWLYCDLSTYGSALPMVRPALLSNGDLVTMFDQYVSDLMSGLTVADVLVFYRHRPDGTLVWRQELRIQDASGVDAIARRGGFAVDGQDYLYITGSTSGQAGQTPNFGDRDVFLMRIGPDGMPH